MKFNEVILPAIEPIIKLDPMIKLLGKLIDSFISRLTLLFLELFWIPIINKRNKQELNKIKKINFFRITGIVITQ